MIRSFRHKGLERLYEKGERRRIPPQYVSKVERILARLDVATGPRDMDLPGYRLHPLRADLEGYWSVLVSRNWRLVFRFDAGDAYDVDLLDYH
jgi:proteic killer suppression protein